LNPTSLQAIINQIFHDAQQDPILQETVASIDPTIVMAKPIHKLRQWITNSHNHMRAHYKAAQLQAKLQTNDIHDLSTEDKFNCKEPTLTTVKLSLPVCGS